MHLRMLKMDNKMDSELLAADSMLMMSKEPRRQQIESSSIVTRSKVTSNQQQVETRNEKETNTSSSNSTATDLSDDQQLLNEGENTVDSGGVPDELTTTYTKIGSNHHYPDRDEHSKERETEESDEVNSTNPNYSLSTPSSNSPAGPRKKSIRGGGRGVKPTRRTFTTEFKLKVLQDFASDPECNRSQRATCRKHKIDRKQLQQWLKQQPLLIGSDYSRAQNSTDEQEEKLRQEKETSISKPNDEFMLGELTISRPQASEETQSSNKSSTFQEPTMPIVSEKLNSHAQGKSSLSPSSPQISTGRNLGNNNNTMFSNNSGNMFMGLPLFGNNVSLPHSMDSSRRSPKVSPNTRGVNGNHHNQGSRTIREQLELIEELNRIYPNGDFSLLSHALLKNEVSLTKLPFPSPTMTINNRKSPLPSPVPSTSKSTPSDYFTLMKNAEYLQMQFLQAGLANLPLTSEQLSSLTDPNKYASWLPYTAAVSAGLSIPELTKAVNGGGNIERNNRRRNDSSNHNQHFFASPKAPVSNSKSKTVAATLAATRNSLGSTRSDSIAPNANRNSFDKAKRPPQRKKANIPRSAKPCTITQPSPDEDYYFDPMSMLEVTTNPPSETELNRNQGMDLSTTSSSVIQNSSVITTTSTLRSKAMNKDYGFLNELGLVRREQSPNNGHEESTYSSTASLENFVQNVLTRRKPSPPVTNSSTSNSPPVSDSNTSVSDSSDLTKEKVLQAFNFDPDVNGDARGVARKFGLNIRVVQKWIKEAPIRSIPSPAILANGRVSLITDGVNPLFNLKTEHDEQQQDDYNDNSLNNSVVAIISTTNPTVNKRKNPKPNQICDYTEDINDDVPLDMVVPIKKRRVTTPTPTSA